MWVLAQSDHDHPARAQATQDPARPATVAVGADAVDEALPSRASQTHQTTSSQSLRWSLREASFAVAIAAVLFGCGEPASRAVAEHDDVRLTRAEPVRDLARRVAFRRHEVQSRWSRAFPLPERTGRRTCPPLAKPDTMLLTLVRDSRIEPRHLLPLRLTERLASSELAMLAADTAGSKNHEDTLRHFDQLSARRFVGVFHIVDYAAPQRIRRIDRPKPEWIAGVLVAAFTVYDLDRHDPQCHVQLVVRNDVKDVPLSRRLQARVRERLIDELADLLHSEAERAIGGITRELTLRKRSLHHTSAAM
jgi:hypothetical protein